jgi:hypothetical protein
VLPRSLTALDSSQIHITAMSKPFGLIDSGRDQEWWAAWSTWDTPGVVGASGALISGPTTNEEKRNIEVKTPSATAGAHQLENLRLNLMSIGTEATRPRTPNSAVPPAPANSAVPTPPRLGPNIEGTMQKQSRLDEERVGPMNTLAGRRVPPPTVRV